jgi:hypothetical protein
MQFPGGKHLRWLQRELFPTSQDIADAREAMMAQVAAQLDALQDAQEAEAKELRRACADRLTPYIGQLVLVSNFKEMEPEESAARISGAVLAMDNFRAGTPPIGVTAVLSTGRSNHESLTETAGTLADSLVGRIGERAHLLPPQRESPDLWLLSLARAAEDTARWAGVPPEELGCVAVVSALDMRRQADVMGLPAPGSAFLLTHIDEDIRFGWDAISLPGYQ